MKAGRDWMEQGREKEGSVKGKPRSKIYKEENQGCTKGERRKGGGP